MTSKLLSPDFLFEVSWEVCNKVGGIHTVISTKVQTLLNELGNNFMLIGPDVYREDRVNPEFTEDPELLRDWREHALTEGIRIRIGRWNIAGKPIVIIVDFTTYINRKDEIFSHFWETYKLDSISGQWDYIEPALFGYATGQVIESYVRYHHYYRDKVIAQFHEWMTGTGILYLKEKLPQVSTVFTTHATALGRSVAGNGRPLYNNLSSFNPDELAREFNILAKQSLEKLSARNADAFTVVSDITARECKQFLQKEVDVITPNGFEDSFVPSPENYMPRRMKARERLLHVASALMGYTLPENSFLLANSGRYEFRNKGIDLVIDTLGTLNKNPGLERNIVAFLLIPANHYGARKNLLRNLTGDCNDPLDGNYLTHNLHDVEYDPIMNRIRSAGLTNNVNDRVKVIFVPSYLNGDDGIFNLGYYDLLPGFDLTLFPSYYEPWGYTPLESIAFSIPTVTTSLSGFGMWVNKEVKEPDHAVYVIKRTDTNEAEVVSAMSEAVLKISQLPADEFAKAMERSREISHMALWGNFIQYYKDAYKIALTKAEDRSDLHVLIGPSVQVQKRPAISEPTWSTLTVQSDLPDALSPLDELANNMWWSWNFEAQELFARIDPQLWEETEHNPIHLLESTDYKRFRDLEKDQSFLDHMNFVINKFHEYMLVKPAPGTPKVAYFSMEFGLHSSVKIYSGGLGILAGDYLKEASDSAADIVGVGLLYRFGYFDQVLSISGEQQAGYKRQTFSQLPLEKMVTPSGDWLTTTLVLPGRIVIARIWKVMVGRVPLYLLDTDHEGNQENDRSITHHLYGGDWENRLKQELLLGIGGIRALDALHIEPDVFHSNEGHSAFIGIERLRKYIVDTRLSFEVAKEIVRASTLFTTHTPVPAGHDAFTEDLLRVYIAHYPQRLNIKWDELMALGRFNPFDKTEKFSMSVLAANLSQEMNGVSRLHGAVSREMFAPLYKGYFPEENHIDYVTNGVHYFTWTAKEWRQVYENTFGDGFLEDQSNSEFWKKIHHLPDRQVWETKQGLKTKLIKDLEDRFLSVKTNRHEHPKHLVDIVERINDKALTIGFARRFATYKRAGLLFNDLDRLDRMVNNPNRPVQFFFAGKAHPHDGAGQDLIKRIVQISRMPQFLGKIVFIEGYDMELARKLVAGVDIWLNTPTRPLEASGTSGEKAVMNGTMHFSVLDGWWCEGYKPNAGWALSEKQVYENHEFQNELDAETIYYTLEDEIIPDYYTRNEEGVPVKWVQYIKNTISEVAPHFTMRRQLIDYQEKFYYKLQKRFHAMLEDDFSLAKDLALWKKMVLRRWENIEVISACIPDTMVPMIKVGEEHHCEVILDLNKLLPEEVGIELLMTTLNGEIKKVVHKQEFQFIRQVEGKAIYRLSINPTKPGTFNFGMRIFPKNKSLPHRQDFCLLKWI
ncbi:MAG: alpha-glucan family phosphorylase [Bacteroidales bacterium]